MKHAAPWLMSVALFSVGCGAAEPEVASEVDEVRAEDVAGTYLNWDNNDFEGGIYLLYLRPDKTFFMAVEGLYGCSGYAGYHCPESWTDGYYGDTHINGTWRGIPSGIKLQPDGEGTPSDPIKLTMETDGLSASLDGTIVPDRHIHGTLNVTSLFKRPHTTNADDIAGAWHITGPETEDGFQPTLWGSNVYIGDDYTHTAVFDDEDNSFHEYRDEQERDTGHYAIAGHPEDDDVELLVLDLGYLFDVHPIVRIADDELDIQVNTFDDGGGRVLELTRMPE